MGVAPELQQVVDMLRDQLSELHAELVCNHLVVWTAGNIAARVPGHDLMVIKPSGVPYDELTPDAMVVCDLNGKVVEGERAPSSDSAAAAYIFRTMPHVGGVVHTHSTYATAWAARGEAIPRPRKLSPASANIAPGTPSASETITGVMALRTRCVRTIWRVPPPMARAART